MKILITEADRLWQEAMRLMYRGRCAWCKGYAEEDGYGHHITGHRYHNIRHELMNGIYLCTPCHHLAHHSPALFKDFLKADWPELFKWHQEHRNPRITICTYDFWQETLQKLRDFIQQQRGANDRA